MLEPEISVIIPLYNRGPYIARALKSVLNQTIQNFEIIVVDSSTDNGTRIVREFDDSRILLIQQKKCGVSAARNYGVEVARAEMISFLDVDDEWMPDHLSALLRLQKKHPNAGAYGTACLIDDGSQRHIALYSDDIPKEPWEGLLPSYFRAAALGFPPIVTSMAAIPKGIFSEMEGFSITTWWGEDSDLWGRIAFDYPIAFSWNGMGIYHTDAINRACNETKPIEENIFVHTAMKAMNDGKVSSNMQRDLLEYVARKQIETAFHNIRAGERILAQANLRKCETKEFVLQKDLALFLAFSPKIVYVILKNIRRILFKAYGQIHNNRNDY